MRTTRSAAPQPDGGGGGDGELAAEGERTVAPLGRGEPSNPSGMYRLVVKGVVVVGGARGRRRAACGGDKQRPGSLLGRHWRGEVAATGERRAATAAAAAAAPVGGGEERPRGDLGDGGVGGDVRGGGMHGGSTRGT